MRAEVRGRDGRCLLATLRIEDLYRRRVHHGRNVLRTRAAERRPACLGSVARALARERRSPLPPKDCRRRDARYWAGAGHGAREPSRSYQTCGYEPLPSGAPVTAAPRGKRRGGGLQPPRRLRHPACPLACRQVAAGCAIHLAEGSIMARSIHYPPGYELGGGKTVVRLLQAAGLRAIYKEPRRGRPAARGPRLAGCAGGLGER